MNISLSDHFTYKKLLRFTFPSIVMMILTSIYGVVDGVFVSNFVGSEAFASINIIMPFLMILGAIGFMTGSGGSALVALTFGTGNEKKAKEIFSLLVYVLIAVGFLFTVGGEILLAPMARLLGADEILLPYCVRYGRIILLALIPFMLQNVFQSFLVVAERPQLGLLITIAAGITNMDPRRIFYRRLTSRRCGSCRRNGDQSVHRRTDPPALLYLSKQESTPSRKAPYGL